MLILIELVLYPGVWPAGRMPQSARSRRLGHEVPQCGGGGEGEKWAGSEGIWEVKYDGLEEGKGVRHDSEGLAKQPGQHMEDGRLGGNLGADWYISSCDLPVTMQMSYCTAAGGLGVFEDRKSHVGSRGGRIDPPPLDGRSVWVTVRQGGIGDVLVALWGSPGGDDLLSRCQSDNG